MVKTFLGGAYALMEKSTKGNEEQGHLPFFPAFTTVAGFLLLHHNDRES